MTPSQNLDRLNGQHFCLHGKFASLARKQWSSILLEAGVVIDKSPSAKTNFLIWGQEGRNLQPAHRGATASLSSAELPRAELPSALQKAHALIQKGHKIEILSEQEFLDSFFPAVLPDAKTSTPDSNSDAAISSPNHGLYTVAQLARILGISGAKIRSWLRAGLIHPKFVQNRLAYFEFGQVSALKTINELIEKGCTSARIAKQLKQLSKWLPEAVLSGQWQVAKAEKNILVNLEDGQVAEANGQLRLPFQKEKGKKLVSIYGTNPMPAAEDLEEHSPDLQDTLFDQALEAEQDGDLDSAAELYLQDLRESGPTAESAFNLGNVFFALGKYTEGIQRYLQAIEIDSTYVEAWNNMGSTYAQLGQNLRAIECYQKAIELVPEYADVYYNIAESYIHLEQLEQAKHYAQQYFAFDMSSEWSLRLRELMLRASTRILASKRTNAPPKAIDNVEDRSGDNENS